MHRTIGSKNAAVAAPQRGQMLPYLLADVCLVEQADEVLA